MGGSSGSAMVPVVTKQFQRLKNGSSDITGFQNGASGSEMFGLVLKSFQYSEMVAVIPGLSHLF